MSKPWVIAVHSDTHFGSKVALCPPGPIPLDDDTTAYPSKEVLWLWDLWNEAWEWVDDIRKEFKADLCIASNGDLFEGDHHNIGQIFSRHRGAERWIAEHAMAVPLALKPQQIIGIRGTESHVGHGARSEENYFQGLADQGYPVLEEEAGAATHYMCRLDVNGHGIELAHHGRMGRRAHTKASQVSLYAADITLLRTQENADRRSRGEPEQPLPELCFRSHFHQHVDSHDAQSVRVIQTPAWQLATAHVHKVATESLADIGMVVAVCIKGEEIIVRKRIRKPRRSKIWAL